MTVMARTVLPLVCLATAASAATGQSARQGMLSLEDARLFYEVVGTGDPIIVVHGGPGLDHAYLQPGLDALATRNTLIYFDQRASGRSVAELDAESINLDAFVGDIEALRQALGYERVTVLGHSFGTLLAIEYALRHPELVHALILMNPVEPGGRYRDATAQRRRSRVAQEDAEELAALQSSEGFEARDPATVSRVYRVAFRASMRDPDRVDELALDLAGPTARNGAEIARLLGESLGTVEWWDRLSGIGAPTLVLHGRYDLPPQEMSLALAEAFPLGSFEVLDSGHFPYLEDREGLQAAVSGFFAGLGR